MKLAANGGYCSLEKQNSKVENLGRPLTDFLTTLLYLKSTPGHDAEKKGQCLRTIGAVNR